MIETVKIISKCTGINNKIDPKRLNENVQETGSADIAEGVNVNIDDSGQIISRPGQLEISSVPSQVWCDKAEGFQVQQRISDAAIFQLNPDASVPATPVVTGLVKGQRLGFWQAGDKTYWSSLSAHGLIVDGINYDWPGYNHVGAATQKVFYPAPYGNKICIFKGRMWIAIGKEIWVSEYLAFGKFRLAAMVLPFVSDVLMMKPVEGGVWVSDSEKIWFLADEGKFESLKWIKKASFPAHEFSENIELTDYSDTYLQILGLCATWGSNEGKCIGTPDGRLIVPTKNKLYYPTGTQGCTVVDGHNIINSVW